MIPANKQRVMEGLQAKINCYFKMSPSQGVANYKSRSNFCQSVQPPTRLDPHPTLPGGGNAAIQLSTVDGAVRRHLVVTFDWSCVVADSSGFDVHRSYVFDLPDTSSSSSSGLSSSPQSRRLWSPRACDWDLASLTLLIHFMTPRSIAGI